MANEKIITTNRQASRDYYIEKKYEAGIELKGNEVKSLRNGNANLKGSFAKFEGSELILCNMHISHYEYSQEEYNPLRERKLLLHRKELNQIRVKSLQQGYAIIPLKVYLRRGYVKVEIALGRGKKFYDKREALKRKEDRSTVVFKTPGSDLAILYRKIYFL